MHTRLLVVILALLSLGIISLLKLPLNLLPTIEQPSLLVRTEWPGASAQEVERAISEPMEALLATVPGLASIHSFTRQELALIEIQLSWDADRDMAFIRIREKLEVLRDQLPSSAKSPTVIRSNASDSPVAVYALSLNHESHDLSSQIQLKNWADQVFARRLEGIDGLAQAVLVGAVESQLVVRFKEDAIARFGISLDELKNVIAEQNRFTSSGLLRDSWYRYSLKLETRLHSEEQLRQLPIKRLENGRVVLIQDVAEIRLEEAPKQSFAEVNGKTIILVQLKKEFGKNTVRVVEDVLPVVEELQKANPEIQITLLSEEASTIKGTIKNLLIALVSGGVLAFLVLFLFLKDPYLPFTIGLSIPLSLLISFFVMYVFKIDLNIVSLGGLTLGIGLLVDNSIVVLENMKRHHSMGKSLLEASKDGTKEIALAATASTLTTVSVFLPLLYLGGVQGVLFRDQALTLSISLLASLAVALFFLPAASVSVSGKKSSDSGLFQQSQWLEGLLGVYKNSLSYCLRFKWLSLGIILGLIILTVLLGNSLERRIMPSSQKTSFAVQIQLPSNAAITTTEFAANEISAMLLQTNPNANIQLWGGFSDQTNLNRLADEALNRFRLDVSTSIPEEMELLKDLVNNWLREKSGWSLEWLDSDAVYGSLLAFSKETVRLSVESPIRESKESYIRRLQTRLEQIRPGSLFEKKYPQEQKIITLQLNDQARRLYAVPLQVIIQQLQSVDLGLEATQWQRGSEQISVRLTRAERRQDISSIPIFWNNQRFRVDQLLDIREEISPELFERVGQQAVETWVLNWDLSDWFAHKSELTAILQEPEFIQERVLISGLGKEIGALLLELSELVLLSILLIYLILAAQFEHWLYPLFMVISVPLAWLGAFSMLKILGLELSLFSGLGLLILTGIAVNDAILKIDFMKRYFEETGDVHLAISEAGKHRFRPVLMTTVTTVLGLLPMLLPFGENYVLSQALAASVVGGMISSTLLTLFVMPLLFYVWNGGRRSLESRSLESRGDL